MSSAVRSVVHPKRCQRHHAEELCTIYTIPPEKSSKRSRLCRPLRKLIPCSIFMKTRPAAQVLGNGTYMVNGVVPFECDQCCICLEKVQARNVMAVLSCKHAFHWQCIQSWLSSKDTCPMCNANLTPKNADTHTRSRSRIEESDFENTPFSSSRSLYEVHFSISNDYDPYINEVAATEAAIAFMNALAEADALNSISAVNQPSGISSTCS